jgi:hypothetical protein
VLVAPNRSKKANGSHLTGKGRDMADNLAETHSGEQDGSPVQGVQAQFRKEFQKS